MHKDSRWAKEIVALQEEDGKWGCFHTLYSYYPSKITTEHALKRLRQLGYTKEDACIKKAITYMNDCLTGKAAIPDRVKKTPDWNVFTELMLAAWIRMFADDNTAANLVAKKWTDMIYAAFEEGYYNHKRYVEVFTETFRQPPKGGHLIDFVNLYPAALLYDCFDAGTEGLFVDYILNHESGMYYVYEKKLSIPPKMFEGKDTSRYLAAIELLLRYKTAGNRLCFVADWLESNKKENGRWDLGVSAKDNLYFPLSGGWGKDEREKDCTEKISYIINRIKK